MPKVRIPRLSWKTPVAELDKNPANWTERELSEEAIAEFERVYGAEKIRGLDPRITAQAKMAAAAKRAAEAKAASEEAIRQETAARAALEAAMKEGGAA